MRFMLSEREEQALADMRDNCLLAAEWSAGLSELEFELDRKTFYAVTRCLEIISEASRRLSDELLERYPAYGWRRMQDAGNFYRHAYHGVVERRVLTSVRQDLPPLLAIAERELATRER
jgi:uncharacterized protein with HEPN domain